MVDFSGFLPVVGEAFADWLKLFIAPAQKLDMLWIIVPIWGVWIFSEFYQEKRGTSFGNAISNGATMLFVGVDWTRYVIRQLSAGELTFGIKTVTLMAVAAVVLIYGLLIIILGIKANKLVRFIGRVRETTYFMVMFSPVIYGVEVLSIRTAAIILAFFPIFYIIIEVVDRFLPTPKTFEADEELTKDFDKGLGVGNDVFGAGQQNSQYGSQFGFPQQPQQQQLPRQQPQQYPQQQKGKKLF
jgi:hypothetical protein